MKLAKAVIANHTTYLSVGFILQTIKLRNKLVHEGEGAD